MGVSHVVVHGFLHFPDGNRRVGDVAEISGRVDGPYLFAVEVDVAGALERSAFVALKEPVGPDFEV
ncbi:hypothetical protein ACFYVL_43985 [Streptomyces sp. NPDC004111]|uniref:hypothetical protein n=1 Tax=Streptomyces sp. NPDC004111 TaxID=3364690 RepID=UPI0036BE3675